LNQSIAAELSHPLKKMKWGYLQKFLRKKISFPKKCVEVWVFDGTGESYPNGPALPKKTYWRKIS
jgi:hypothetical protein